MPAQGAEPDGGLTVTLSAVQFQGATLVPATVLDAIAAPYLGRAMPVSEVFRLAEAVTEEYRRRGYVLSRAVVGPQRIEGGVVTLQVVEGFIGQARVEGDAGGYLPYLDAYLDPLRGGRPTTGDDLARALLLAQDLQGVDVRAVLTPSADTLGAADLSLVAERRPFEAYVAADNRGSRWLGPVQVFGGIIFNDVLGAAERLSLSTVAAPDEGGELGYVSVGYEQPLGGSGLLASMFASRAVTRPGDELRDLGLEGTSVSGGFALQYPLVRSRAANLIGRLAFTARNSQSSNIFLDPAFRDRTRTVTGEVNANQATSWGGRASLRLSVTQGLDALGATVASDPAKSRATASGRFTRFNAEASWLQQLYEGLHVLVGGAAQLTSDSLLASEEFGIGGLQFGRAFDPSEITGDEGFAGKVELLYAYPARGLGSVEPYFYYEGGRVLQNDPLPGELHRESLESVGGGVRVRVDGGLAATFEYAQPIRRDIAATGNRDGRMFVSLSAAY